MALLELFAREAAPRFKCSLSAVHVNHRLRSGAGLDQMLVEELCADRGIPLRVETLDPASRRAGQSVEMWGREHRYSAFTRAAAQFGAGMILTAHHRDDVVETVCLRLWRGTGLAGLAGIPFLRDDGVARPLLPVPRADLRTWLGELGTPWREDESNADTRVPRSWVRHRLLPAWRGEDSSVDGRIFRLARDAAKLLPAWEKWARMEHPEEEVRARGGIPADWLRAGMDAASLKTLLAVAGVAAPSPELAREVLRQAVASASMIRVRTGEGSVLREKNGVLSLTASVFKRRKGA